MYPAALDSETTVQGQALNDQFIDFRENCVTKLTIVSLKSASDRPYRHKNAIAPATFSLATMKIGDQAYAGTACFVGVLIKAASSSAFSVSWRSSACAQVSSTPRRSVRMPVARSIAA
jgi:hypothetical protein